MSKHTPGPWKLDRNSVLIPIAPYEWAEAYGGTEANARLIAAAPMMLELLKRLLPIAEDAAESLGRFCSDEGWAQEDMDRMDNVDGMLPLMRAAIKAVEEEA